MSRTVLRAELVLMSRTAPLLTPRRDACSPLCLPVNCSERCLCLIFSSFLTVRRGVCASSLFLCQLFGEVSVPHSFFSLYCSERSHRLVMSVFNPGKTHRLVMSVFNPGKRFFASLCSFLRFEEKDTSRRVKTRLREEAHSRYRRGSE